MRVHDVRPFTIHGDLYYELHVTRGESPNTAMAVRVPQHAVAQAPSPGDTLELTFLMGQITAAKRV